MAGSFQNVRFHIGQSAEEDVAELGIASTRARGARRGGGGRARGVPSSFTNDEAAARFYLTQVFERDARPTVRGLAASDEPDQMPDFRMVQSQASPLTKSRVVTFEQTQTSVPVFGSHVRVELTTNRDLIGVNADVAEVDNVSAVPSISQAEALKHIATYTEALPGDLEQVAPAELTFFQDEPTGTWHLAFFFRDVPAAPQEMISDLENSRGHGLGRSPRNRHPRVNFLVDAHTADVLFYYSAAPTVAVPVKCKGTDEDNVQRTFFAQQAGTGIELVDPMRFVKTYDLKLGDIDDATAFPEAAIQSASSDLGTAHKAAISALWNATQVYDFYNDVLQRHGIDDKGMDLVSVVNCTYAEDEPAPEWHNAVWFNKRMWYGQISNGTSLLSYSRFLDVIAHELTHGVTQFTSNLVYKNESGALNESFSDIFGIIISNWVRVGKDSEVKDWSWEFGPGLGDSGLPLRDLSDPTRTGDPDHTSKYVPTPFDSGGVHTNSNIHNKAAYNVLTEVGANGDRVFPVREVAILYYLCLTRLGSLATFQKTLQELIDVASTFYGGDPTDRDAKVGHLKNAYAKAGITLT